MDEMGKLPEEETSRDPEVPHPENISEAPESAQPTDFSTGLEEARNTERGKNGDIPIRWQFRRNSVSTQPPKKRGTLFFFAIFGAAFAVIIVLLILTMFLGNNGFKIVNRIETERTIYVREYDGSGGLLTPNEAAEAARVSAVTVSVRTASGSVIGSGFVYTADGYIVTNNHVVAGQTSVQVILGNGETLDARLIGTDEMSDLAVLKVEKSGLVPVTLGSSSQLLVGEDVVAVGTPAQVVFAGTATFGKVSAINRMVPLTDESGTIYKKMKLIQTDASVNPGNSGGPLVDLYGRTVGIVVMRVSYFGGSVFDGIGFAIPIDSARTVIDALIREGRYAGENLIGFPRSLLGVGGRGLAGNTWYLDPTAEKPVTSDVEKAGYFYMPEDGIYVISVNGNSNAKGKISVGDIILKVNGFRVYSVYDVMTQVNLYRAGETVRLTVLRKSGTNYTPTTVDILLYEE